MNVDEREQYYRQRNAEIQKGIVNYKTSSTLTSESFIWTYRTTSCDVISLITTTVPIKNGNMDDIQLPDREVKRLKPASKKKHSYLMNNPLDAGFFADQALKRKQVNEQLLKERQSFMSKLYVSRHLRSSSESRAATLIQAVYRGYYTRNNMYEISQYAEVNKQIRSNIRSYLANKYGINISLTKYKKTLMKIRNRSAVVIQCAFFCYISRVCVRRRRHELLVKRRREAATIIQSLARGASARSRVALLVERIRIVLIMKSVVKIQGAIRMLLAKQRVRIRRYKLRWVACCMIQNFYKTRFSRKMAQNIRKIMDYKRQFKGALKMQCCVRKFLSKRRVDRIRLRRLHKLIFRYVTLIQLCIRRFVAKKKVERKRVIVNAKRAEEEEAKRKRIAEEVARKEAEDTKALLESVDIFLQARKGNTSDVDDIYTGLVSTDEHHPTDVDPGTGDTILHIAAANGNLDLVRKCLLWRFDPNQRNLQGYNAFMVAAKNDKLEVMKYIISPPPASASDGNSEDGVINLELPISEEDAGYLMVTAAANAATSGLAMLKFLLNLDLDINSKNETTGMTAIHAACEIGHVEAFKLLVQRNCEMEAEDDMGQLALHKACQSNHTLVKYILGLDPNFDMYMSDQTRVLNILRTDADGKDCLLLAAIAGQVETLKILEQVVKDAETAGVDINLSRKVGSSKGSEDISWTAPEISKVLKLVETNNIACIEKLADVGYDFNFAEVDSGRTTAIAACQGGHTEAIDLIMSYSLDFTVPDAEGNTAIHHAAQCRSSPLLANLLTHQYAATCNIDEKSLLITNSLGENVFHIAARVGVNVQIDLLAQGIMKDGLSARNTEGLTPLQVACSYRRVSIIENYIKLGSDAQALDSKGRSCIWHLFHACDDFLSKNPEKRPACSEFNTLSGISTGSGPSNRKEIDEDVVRVNDEVKVVISLLRAGCSLYSDYGMTPDDMRQKLPYQWNEAPSILSQKKFEPGDIAIQEYSMVLIKNIVKGVITPLEGWRLLIASIWFDDGSAKVITALLKAGIIDLLTQAVIDAEEEDAAVDFNDTRKRLFSRGTPHGRRTAPSSSDSVSTTKSPLGKQKGSNEDTFPVSNLQDIYFLDLSIMGWAIRLHKPRVVQFLIKKGFDSSVAVDIEGNPALHYIALHGTVDMVDSVLADKKILLEGLNSAGYTASMLAAKVGNFAIAKKLFERRSSPRRSLDGAYAAWILAFVRKAEKNEMNLQTGRYGDDDELYFSIAPDPFYTTWYAP